MQKITLFLNLNAEYPIAFQMWHQTPASVTAEVLIDLHHFVMFYILLIFTVVVIFLFGAVTTSAISKSTYPSFFEDPFGTRIIIFIIYLFEILFSGTPPFQYKARPDFEHFVPKYYSTRLPFRIHVVLWTYYQRVYDWFVNISLGILIFVLTIYEALCFSGLRFPVLRTSLFRKVFNYWLTLLCYVMLFEVRLAQYFRPLPFFGIIYSYFILGFNNWYSCIVTNLEFPVPRYKVGFTEKALFLSFFPEVFLVPLIGNDEEEDEEEVLEPVFNWTFPHLTRENALVELLGYTSQFYTFFHRYILDYMLFFVTIYGPLFFVYLVYHFSKLSDWLKLNFTSEGKLRKKLDALLRRKEQREYEERLAAWRQRLKDDEINQEKFERWLAERERERELEHAREQDQRDAEKREDNDKGNANECNDLVDGVGLTFYVFNLDLTRFFDSTMHYDITLIPGYRYLANYPALRSTEYLWFIRGDYESYRVEGRNLFIAYIQTAENRELRYGPSSQNFKTLGFKRVFNIKSSVDYYRSLTHAWVLEIFWTLLPSFILLFIAIPSLFVLYIIDEPFGYVLTVFKVIGHQWYWSYEIADCTFNAFTASKHTLPVTQFSFDSFMLPTSEIRSGQLRLLEVDHPLYVPIRTPLAFVVTADDVLHSWSVPSLGIKIDAVPGRLNQVYCFITRHGEFYGQCSELCGIHHGFMPIHVISI